MQNELDGTIEILKYIHNTSVEKRFWMKLEVAVNSIHKNWNATSLTKLYNSSLHYNHFLFKYEDFLLKCIIFNMFIFQQLLRLLLELIVKDTIISLNHRITFKYS